MFTLFRGKKLTQMTADAATYVKAHYHEHKVSPIHHTALDTQDSGIRYSLRGSPEDTKVQYSISEQPNSLTSAMRLFKETQDKETLLNALDASKTPSFTDSVISYMRENSLSSVSVYRRAQIDRKLFSKMLSDQDFHPSKDTALAITFALHLPYFQATDLLCRSGYALSHSSRRDLIIEYFLREQIFDLNDVNEVLDRLGEKIIGRKLSY